MFLNVIFESINLQYKTLQNYLIYKVDLNRDDMKSLSIIPCDNSLYTHKVHLFNLRKQESQTT